MPLISAEDALKLVLNTCCVLDTERVPLQVASARVLREPLVADRAFPPFDRVMMDGVALRRTALEAGQRAFTVETVARAGVPQQTLNAAGCCLEVMTGAPLPLGTDTIIPVEVLETGYAGAGGTVTVSEDGAADALAAEIGRYVHAQASDHASGEVLAEPGQQLGAAGVAVAATVGLAEPLVTRKVRVQILTTGDELVPVQAVPEAHQIRQSNGAAIAALVEETGLAEATVSHMADDPEAQTKALGEVLERADLVVLSGGVSKGQADHLPEVLRGLGVETVFHGVAQRPGKPFWFGKHGAKLVLALPGNPNSALIGARRYIIPAIERMTGMLPALVEKIQLDENFRFAPPLTAYIPARLVAGGSGVRRAKPAPAANSGDLAALLATDGLLVLPAEQNDFAAGDAVEWLPW